MATNEPTTTAGPIALDPPAAKNKAPAAPTKAAAPTVADRVEAEMEGWWVEHVHNSILSRLPTDVLNYLRAGFDKLKARVLAKL